MGSLVPILDWIEDDGEPTESVCLADLSSVVATTGLESDRLFPFSTNIYTESRLYNKREKAFIFTNRLQITEDESLATTNSSRR